MGMEIRMLTPSDFQDNTLYVRVYTVPDTVVVPDNYRTSSLGANAISAVAMPIGHLERALCSGKHPEHNPVEID